MYVYYLIDRHAPTSTLFPYTTLFRSYKPTPGMVLQYRLNKPATLYQVPGEMTAHELRELFDRSEEHTSELQSRPLLVCLLLLEENGSHELIVPWTLAQQGKAVFNGFG